MSAHTPTRLSIDALIPRSEPHLGEDPDWSKVLYANPPSHDFMLLVMLAEIVRREKKSPAPLTVSLLLHDGMLGKYDLGNFGILAGKCDKPNLSLAYSNQMIANVVRPAIDMIGAVEGPLLHVPVDLAQINDYCEYDYHGWRLVDACKGGYAIPKWLPPVDWADKAVDNFLQGEIPVTITLREAELQPERNSQIEEWTAFAELIEKKHPVVFLRDTNAANFPLGKWRTWPRASENAYVRYALYQRAFCNLFVSNGPVGWCMFSDAPWLQFKQLIPALPNWDHGNAKGWWDQDHLRIGEQWPWSGPHQRLTWKDDTAYNICAEFEAFVSLKR